MPELPEVEVLARHLGPLLQNKTVRSVHVLRAKVIAPTPLSQLLSALKGARFVGLRRRGKYLVFTLAGRRADKSFELLGHLGMTGRMYLQAAKSPLPKHAAVVLDLGAEKFVFEDTRYFGRFTLDCRPLERLGPEPLSDQFRSQAFALSLKRSRQAIKVKLLDQSLIAGLGNIYASEALFRARIAPGLPSKTLSRQQTNRLYRAIRDVLREAVACGSTVPLNFPGIGKRDGLFYFGRADGAPDFYEERLRVYDRAGQPCPRCGVPIRRRIHAARSTFYCPSCQRR